MKQNIRLFYFNKQKEQLMASSQKILSFSRQSLPQKTSQSSSDKLKAQIDVILQNDIAVLSNNPNADHHSLLTKHNNPLLLKYIKQIYSQYNIKDPLPNHHNLRLKTEPQSQAQVHTSQKKKSKLHLYSSQAPSKFTTPIRQQRSSPSQQIKTQPTRKLVTLGPSLINKDLEQNDLTMKKEIPQNETTLKASNSYFQNKSAEPSFGYAYNEPSTLHDPQKFILTQSRKYQKGKQMRIQEEEPFQSVEQGIQIAHFSLPYTPTLPNQFIKDSSLEDFDIKRVETEPRTLPNNESFIQRTSTAGENLLIQGADVAQSRLMMPYPLPQIIKANGNVQDGEIKDSFRYCIGCEKALLDANIKIHEKRCRQFQRVLALSNAEIIEHLKSKISSFQRNIQIYSEELLKIDANNLEEHSQKMLAQSRSILGEGRLTKAYERQYGQIMDISRKWCLMTEEINKVNWFLKIRQRVKKQLQI